MCIIAESYIQEKGHLRQCGWGWGPSYFAWLQFLSQVFPLPLVRMMEVIQQHVEGYVLPTPYFRRYLVSPHFILDSLTG